MLKTEVAYGSRIRNPTGQFHAGDTLRINVRVTNIGSSMALNVAVYLNVMNGITSEYLLLEEQIGGIANISAGSNHVFSEDKMIPLDAGIADYYGGGIMTCDTANPAIIAPHYAFDIL